MIEKSQWRLEEIRESYGEILKAYNAIFPLHPRTRAEQEDVMIEGLDFDLGYSSIVERNEGLTKISRRLKDAADRSGNAVTWRSGEPLDNLNRDMRNRIEKGLRFGI